MHFKALLLLFGFLALSTAMGIPKPMKSNNLRSALERFNIRIPKYEGSSDIIDGTPYFEYCFLIWNVAASFATLDDVKFFDSHHTVPTMSGESIDIEFRNTHLRGLHKLGFEEGSTIERGEDYTILNVTGTSDKIEFHSEMIEHNEEGSFILGMRSLASIKNLKLHLSIHVRYTEVIPIIKILEMNLIETPEISVFGKTLSSQFGDIDPSGNTGMKMAKVTEYIKTTHLPQLLRTLVNQNTIATFNQLADKMFSRKTGDSSPLGYLDEYAFNYFYDHKYQMCDSYKLQLNHTLDIGADRITVKNGAIRGLDYFRRTECGNIESCMLVACPDGDFIYNYDDIYIDYDVEATSNGRRHAGKMTVTISGMQGQDIYSCKTECSVWWYCTTFPVTSRTEFLKQGKVLVDVTGLPESLHSRHSDLIAFAEATHSKLLSQISAGAYDGSHFDNDNCVVL